MDYLTTPNQTSRRPAPMVAEIQRQMEVSLARMQTTSLAYQSASDEVDNLFGYTVWKAFNSTVAVATLRQAAAMQGQLTPEMDRMLLTLTEGYLRDIATVRNVATVRFLQLADDVASGRVPPETLTMKLRRLLQG